MNSDNMNKEPKALNFNTLMLTLVMLMVTLTGFFSKHLLDGIEGKLDKMMPRQEIQLELEMIKASHTRVESDLLEFRTRLQLVELSQARMLNLLKQDIVK